MTLYSRRKRTVNKGKKNKTVNRRRGKSMRGGEWDSQYFNAYLENGYKKELSDTDKKQEERVAEEKAEAKRKADEKVLEDEKRNQEIQEEINRCKIFIKNNEPSFLKKLGKKVGWGGAKKHKNKTKKGRRN
jgi:hypothetical protein